MSFYIIISCLKWYIKSYSTIHLKVYTGAKQLNRQRCKAEKLKLVKRNT